MVLIARIILMVRMTVFSVLYTYLLACTTIVMNHVALLLVQMHYHALFCCDKYGWSVRDFVNRNINLSKRYVFKVLCNPGTKTTSCSLCVLLLHI